MAGLWGIGGLLAILAVIIAAGMRWDAAGGRRDAHAHDARLGEPHLSRPAPADVA